MTENPIPMCDHCSLLVHRQMAGGWWVGQDETSDCDVNAAGHTVNGDAR